MALLNIVKTTVKSLPTIPIRNGQVLICLETDTKGITKATRGYYDNGNRIRIDFTDKLTSYTSYNEMIANPAIQDDPHSLEGILFYVIETSALYRFYVVRRPPWEGGISNVWKECATSDDLKDIIMVFTEMIPTTLSNTVIGTGDKRYYAPRTLASAVYMRDGDNIEDKLSMISNVSNTQTDVSVSRDAESEFTIPIPFKKYFSYGNAVNIYLNGLLIPSEKYEINTKNNSVLLNNNIVTKANDIITFNFIYNSHSISKTPTVIDGAYITDHSIQTSKLAKIANSYHEVDNDKLVTSNILNNAMNTINNALNGIQGDRIISAISTGNAYLLSFYRTNYTLQDGDTIFLTCNENVGADAKLTINDLPAKNIVVGVLNGQYVDIQDNMVYKNETMCLKYNKVADNFMLTNGDYYTNRERSTAIVIDKPNTTDIFFTIEGYDPINNNLIVYQDGLRLIEGINYNRTKNGIRLIDYTAEVGSTFLFTTNKVVKSFYCAPVSAPEVQKQLTGDTIGPVIAGGTDTAKVVKSITKLTDDITNTEKSIKDLQTQVNGVTKQAIDKVDAKTKAMDQEIQNISQSIRQLGNSSSNAANGAVKHLENIVAHMAWTNKVINSVDEYDSVIVENFDMDENSSVDKTMIKVKTINLPNQIVIDMNQTVDNNSNYDFLFHTWFTLTDGLIQQEVVVSSFTVNASNEYTITTKDAILSDFATNMTKYQTSDDIYLCRTIGNILQNPLVEKSAAVDNVLICGNTVHTVTFNGNGTDIHDFSTKAHSVPQTATSDVSNVNNFSLTGVYKNADGTVSFAVPAFGVVITNYNTDPAHSWARLNANGDVMP